MCAQVAFAQSTRMACPLSNRFCQLKPRFSFGAAVIDDKVGAGASCHLQQLLQLAAPPSSQPLSNHGPAELSWQSPCMQLEAPMQQTGAYGHVVQDNTQQL
jgi:hypothetical protein